MVLCMRLLLLLICVGVFLLVLLFECKCDDVLFIYW